MRLVDASIAELRAALETGRTSSVALVAGYLNRIAFYDRHGARLNSVTALNPAMFEEALASDRRRARGEVLGPLDGIPYTAKDSYMVKGLPVSAGSPAFADLIAADDAFAIARLRAAGAIFIGHTNMPPMANGGMQRGLHGRAESPYNADWLTAAFASGSSNGSGTATAASFAAFGLGEETWSSGRAPASNNALCAYTPSRGVISVRGNWPLVPTMDVVVPHTRTMADLLELLDVIVADDPETRGDFWRMQPWVKIPKASGIRPASYAALAEDASLKGKRIGVPAMYINADPKAGTAAHPGIGGPTGQRIDTRPSIIALWEAARQAMEAAGAEVVLVDFPAVSNYEGDRPGCPTIKSRELVGAEYLQREIVDLSVWSWEEFLSANGRRLANVDGGKIFPVPKGSLPDRYTGFDDTISLYPDYARSLDLTDFRAIPHIAEGVKRLEETRRIDLEDWMDNLGLDAIVFPAVADVGPADADTDPASADVAWRNGVWVANGNLAIRHLGIPTVTVPMGTMADIGMPAGLTFAGRAYQDTFLLQLAAAFEATGARRVPPPRTPELGTPFEAQGAASEGVAAPDFSTSAELLDTRRVRITAEFGADAIPVTVTVDGEPVRCTKTAAGYRIEHIVPRNDHRHSEWLEPWGHLLIVLFDNGTAGFRELSP
ncbi:amidase [Nisaea sediminum]|uniref:amidase n=1 Tax=Nisaea sediminum TaxID=2775867 RepID=UPI001865B13C|nr:amidase [Nisaea sediminum]